MLIVFQWTGCYLLFCTFKTIPLSCQQDPSGSITWGVTLTYFILIFGKTTPSVKPNLNSWCTKQISNQCLAAYSYNAMDETPMYDMPLVFVCWLWGFVFWGEHFWSWGVGVLSFAFCPKIVLSSTGYLTEYVNRSAYHWGVVDCCLYVPINIAVPRELWEPLFHTKLEPKLVFRICRLSTLVWYQQNWKKTT